MMRGPWCWCNLIVLIAIIIDDWIADSSAFVPVCSWKCRRRYHHSNSVVVWAIQVDETQNTAAASAEDAHQVKNGKKAPKEQSSSDPAPKGSARLEDAHHDVPLPREVDRYETTTTRTLLGENDMMDPPLFYAEFDEDGVTRNDQKVPLEDVEHKLLDLGADIEFASHSPDDKLDRIGIPDLITGSLNITAIESGEHLPNSPSSLSQDLIQRYGIVADEESDDTPSISSGSFPGNLLRGMRFQNRNKEKEENLSPLQKRRLARQRQRRMLRGQRERRQQADDSSDTTSKLSFPKFWKRRRARNLEEGIQREKEAIDIANCTKTQLSTILNTVENDAAAVIPPPERSRLRRAVAARTITGLITALAEEVDGLTVEVDARRETPLWGKHVDAVKIQFSRLGFTPMMRMGGLDQAIRDMEADLDDDEKQSMTRELNLAAISCPDEAFETIDVDNSGSLDSEEIAKALKKAATTTTAAATRPQEEEPHHESIIDRLATKLVQLYDLNGDGVVDRDEYQTLVTDMAVLRQVQQESLDQREEQPKGLWGNLKRVVPFRRGDDKSELSRLAGGGSNVPRDIGSIVLSDLKLDLRRLLFGGIPVIKHITPGGPLILEPFTFTISGSFNREDVLNSFLLDGGLRMLVARALRRRAGSLRDLTDGALFFGRQWKETSTCAPVVDVPKLTNVEFDDQNRLVVTGRARIRTSPEAPIVKNTFKVRMKLGTRNNGRVIRMVEPELALVLECPKELEDTFRPVFEALNLKRPEPIYSFFPIYSPFKVQDNDGFDLGADNCIQSIYIQDGALRFVLSAVVRPGRFLGNHYLAFTLPNRTFILTMDRIREGIQAARSNKKRLQAERKAAAAAAAAALQKPTSKTLRDDSKKKKGLLSWPRGLPFGGNNDGDMQKKKLMAKRRRQRRQKKTKQTFFERFVEGYNRSDDVQEAQNERLTIAISDWFGRQGTNEGNSNNDDDDDGNNQGIDVDNASATDKPPTSDRQASSA